MNKSLIAIVLLFFVATSCQLEDTTSSDGVTPENFDKPTVMTFDEPEHNFGSLDKNGTLVHSFKFTNTGNAPLVLFDVKPSCGCTALKGWPKEAILPGGSSEIAIEMNPKVASPKVTKTISIIANTEPSLTVLKLIGEVKQN
jgi:hypothetical protein